MFPPGRLFISTMHNNSGFFAILAAACSLIAATATLRPPVPPTKHAPKPKPASVRAVALVSPVVLTLSWDYPVSEISPDLTFRVYHSTNIASPSWVLVTNVVGVTTATVPVIPGVHVFAVTSYSTFWGIESPFSDAASTPPAPRSGTNLKLSR